MNDLPFGFSSGRGDGDDDRDRKGDGSSSNPSGGDPFGMGGFDPNQLGQMLSQLGSMLSGMGQGGGSSGGGPVNYQVATSLARQQIGDFSPLDEKQRTAVTEAVRLAEVWLDGTPTCRQV